MQKYLIALLAIALLTPWVGFASPMEAAQAPPAGSDFARQALKQRAMDAYLKLPLYFIANEGQIDESVAYYAQGNGHSIYFTAEEMVMALNETILRTRFVGAKATPPLGAEQTEAIVNYFIGNDPAKWQTNIPTYGEIVYHDLYPGIDLRYAGQNGALKYTFIVSPGADLSQIRLAYGGAAGLRLDEEGNLLILAGGNELKDTKPYAYQEIGGRRVEVDVAFVLHGVHTCGFAVQGAYEPRYPLIIDPTLLYSTYLGGSSSDVGTGIAVDGTGHAYVAGFTWSTDFPTQNPSQGTHGGGYYDAFVAKIDTTESGTASLLYSTYLGGSGYDWGWGIAVDGAGNAYVTGWTLSDNFPRKNAYDDSLGGSIDAFVTKLNDTGDDLLYSTYLGGSSSDWGRGIAVDGDGNAYVRGRTRSTNFPTQNAYQATYGGGRDTFVTKLNAAGSDLLYSTYLGGSESDHGRGIAVDGDGNAYVTGTTSSYDFPTQNPYQGTGGGPYGDAFVTKIDTTKSDAASLIYSTYLGGSGNDFGEGIAVDGAGNAYVTGMTSSSDFPTQNAYQATYGGGGGPWGDAFVTKLNAAGDDLLYSTYLGGSASDFGCGIAVDGDGNAYVTGTTSSSDFPTQNAYQGTCGGCPDRSDTFVTKLNAAGNTLVYSTYLGGSSYEENGGRSDGIAVDGAGNAYVTGLTYSTDFPTQNAYQAQNAGYVDVFIAVFGPAPNLSTSSKQVSPAIIEPTGTVTHTLLYTITLANTGELTATAAYLTDTLPSDLSLTVSPACTGGTCNYNAGNHTVTWTGSLASNASVVITYAGLVSVPIGTEDTIYFVNTVQIDDGTNAPFTLMARSAVNPQERYLPIIRK